MEVRAKKALGQHFLTDQSIARHIVDTLSCPVTLPGAVAAAPDRGRPWPREWEGPAPSGVGGMSEAKSSGGNTSEEQPGPE